VWRPGATETFSTIWWINLKCCEDASCPKQCYCTNEHVQVCFSLAGKGAQALLGVPIIRQQRQEDISEVVVKSISAHPAHPIKPSRTSWRFNFTETNCRHRPYQDCNYSTLFQCFQLHLRYLSACIENHRWSILVICTTKYMLSRSSTGLRPRFDTFVWVAAENIPISQELTIRFNSSNKGPQNEKI